MLIKKHDACFTFLFSGFHLICREMIDTVQKKLTNFQTKARVDRLVAMATPINSIGSSMDV